MSVEQSSRVINEVSILNLIQRPLIGLATPLALFLSTRLALLIAAFFANNLLPSNPNGYAWFVLPRWSILDAWVRWDAGWYLIIAKEGFNYSPLAPDLSLPTLPLFPLLIRLFAPIFSDLALSALFASNLAFAAASVLLYRLALRHGDSGLATRSVLFVGLVPFVPLLGAAQAEGLTLLLAVGVFYLLEQSGNGRFISASLVASLAVLTTPSGLALLPALLVWLLSKKGRLSRARICALCLPVVSYIGFGLFLYFLGGWPLDLIRTGVLGETNYSLLRGLDAIGRTWTEASSFRSILIIGSILGLLYIILALLPRRSFGLTGLVFIVSTVLLGFIVGPDGLGGWLVIAFPALITLSIYSSNEKVEFSLFASAPLLVALFMMLYAGWYPIESARSPISPTIDRIAWTNGLSTQSGFQVHETRLEPVSFEVRNETRIVGYSYSSDRIILEESLRIDLDMLVIRPSYRKLNLSVRLSDINGQVRAVGDYGSDMPVGHNEADVDSPRRYRLSPYIKIGSDMPSGLYTPELLLFDRETGERMPIVAQKSGPEVRALLSPIVVLRPEERLSASDVKSARISGATFSGQIALQGFELSASEVQPGQTLAATLYWHALKKPEYDYTVFLQLLDPDGKLIARSDVYPLQGRFPTSKWKANETLRDVQRIEIPGDAKAGPAKLIVGLYRLETMERLLLTSGGGGDSLTLTTLSLDSSPDPASNTTSREGAR